MQAMILAGGMSTRLYPLTKQVPKPIVPVAGEPISGHVMRWLRSFGYDEIAINVFYLAERVERRSATAARYGVHAPLSARTRAHRQRGRASSRWRAGSTRRSSSSAATISPTPISVRSCAFTRQRGALATIGLVEADEVDQYGVVILDDDGRITGFQEKPAKGTEKSKLANTGIYVFEPAIFERIPADTFYDFGKQVFPELLRDGLPFYGDAPRGRVLARRRHAGRIPPRDRRRARAAASRSAARARPAFRRARTSRATRGSTAGPRRRERTRSRAARASSGPSVIGDGVRDRRRRDARAHDRLERCDDRRRAPSCATRSSASATSSATVRPSTARSSRTSPTQS